MKANSDFSVVKMTQKCKFSSRGNTCSNEATKQAIAEKLHNFSEFVFTQYICESYYYELGMTKKFYVGT